MTTNGALNPLGLLLEISGVERETGLSKDVLRMWERRYGFPAPIRDAHGKRRYAAADLARLRAVKRLTDAGMRPGKIVNCSIEELNLLGALRDGSANAPTDSEIVGATLGLLRRHDASGLRNALADLLMRQGLHRFVVETIPPINRAVGEAWMRGDLQIFEEHLYTEQLHSVLLAAINTFPRRTGGPRVLLTTLPGERHNLGLLMVEALLVPEGAQCISLGVETPLDDIRRAALAHAADIVALSFSGAYPMRRAIRELTSLRRHLPTAVWLWAGGAMTGRLCAPPAGVVLIPDLAATIDALQGWRRFHAVAEEAPATHRGRQEELR